MAGDGSTSAIRFPNVRFSKHRRSDPKELQELADSVLLKILRLNTERQSLEASRKSLGTTKDSQELRNSIRTTGSTIKEIAKQTVQDFNKLTNSSHGSEKSLKARTAKLKEDFKEALQLCREAQKLTLSTLETTCLPTEVEVMESISLTQDEAPSPHVEEQASTEIVTCTSQEKQEIVDSMKKDITDVNQVMNELDNLDQNQSEVLVFIEAINDSPHTTANGQQSSALEQQKTLETKRRFLHIAMMSSCSLLLCILVILIILVALGV